MPKAVKGAPIFCRDSPLIKSDNREEKKQKATVNMRLDTS